MSDANLVIVSWTAALILCSIAFGAACMKIYGEFHLSNMDADLRRYLVIGLLMLLGIVTSLIRLMQFVWFRAG